MHIQFWWIDKAILVCDVIFINNTSTSYVFNSVNGIMSIASINLKIHEFYFWVYLYLFGL